MGCEPVERPQGQSAAWLPVGRRLETVLQTVTRALTVLQRQRPAADMQAPGQQAAKRPIRMPAKTQCLAAGSGGVSATEATAAASAAA